MTHSDEATGTARAEDAINRVLRAEQRAREKVARCDAQAVALVGAARERALRVAERTDQRIVGLRTRCERHVAEQVVALRARTEIVRRQPVGDDTRRATLAEAVARLAARLTDGES